MNRIFYLDGYNILYHWNQTEHLMQGDAIAVDCARELLIREMANYLGFTNQSGTIIFDAYQVHEGEGSVFQSTPNLTVVYTKSGETADERIEVLLSQQKAQQRSQSVIVTGDGILQGMAFAYGAARMTCDELLYSFQMVSEKEKQKQIEKQKRNTLDRVVSSETWNRLNAIRIRKSKGD